ncbi:MAG TPA: hypothetical protein PK359_20910 [Burkholderiaceae bacterium]|jgi:hypothetical protein|nr:hypothetical protein [Burkholderiaceae bacterium]
MATRVPESVRPVFDWLGNDPNCRQLALQAERLVALQAVLAAVSPLPGLIPLELDDEGCLKVATPGAAAAAKLRQLEPSLIAELVSRGWKVKRIRFRPQPASGSPPAPIPVPRAPIPPSALSELDALAQRTPAGGLKQALANLLRHQAHRSR